MSPTMIVILWGLITFLAVLAVSSNPTIAVVIGALVALLVAVDQGLLR